MALWTTLKEKLKGVTERWGESIASLFSGKALDEAFWDELEERLLAGDVGIDTTTSLLEEMRRGAMERRIGDTGELRGAFTELLISRLQKIPGMGQPLPSRGNPSVVLLVGVNGNGKTTTAGKLAALASAEGRRVILAGADTYRAAAGDQIRIWGERAGVRTVIQTMGSDAAAVVYDAIQAARSSGADLVIADTAGRLHTKHNLMEELRKVQRIALREAGEDVTETFLVLDAVTGQNALRQAEVFHASLSLTGIVLTKYDSTAKGGILLGVAERFQLPIRYVGLGEGIEDLQLFDPQAFVRTLFSDKDHDQKPSLPGDPSPSLRGRP
ncbi:MAG TPA: signal recognition particle-docking protein FtsY [Synergistaceae bacterium]|nr:signal recognition particle-docking protein FtsY [Synergistaceae bacterium]